MASTERIVHDTTWNDIDIEEALNPCEPGGTARDSRECAALALAGGSGGLLLSPPTPRPKKG
ncbi:hypothetical protein [Streptomyces sp. NPDC088915]|uniref:hypothetical protein n=1 Tax=Streptomyces sp. NPDC088915 TaxID=3365912 RepID=UPI0037FBEC7F